MEFLVKIKSILRDIGYWGGIIFSGLFLIFLIASLIFREKVHIKLKESEAISSDDIFSSQDIPQGGETVSEIPSLDSREEQKVTDIGLSSTDYPEHSEKRQSLSGRMFSPWSSSTDTSQLEPTPSPSSEGISPALSKGKQLDSTGPSPSVHFNKPSVHFKQLSDTTRTSDYDKSDKVISDSGKQLDISAITGFSTSQEEHRSTLDDLLQLSQKDVPSKGFTFRPAEEKGVVSENRSDRGGEQGGQGEIFIDIDL